MKCQCTKKTEMARCNVSSIPGQSDVSSRTTSTSRLATCGSGCPALLKVTGGRWPAAATPAPPSAPPAAATAPPTPGGGRSPPSQSPSVGRKGTQQVNRGLSFSVSRSHGGTRLGQQEQHSAMQEALFAAACLPPSQTAAAAAAAAQHNLNKAHLGHQCCVHHFLLQGAHRQAVAGVEALPAKPAAGRWEARDGRGAEGTAVRVGRQERALGWPLQHTNMPTALLHANSHMGCSSEHCAPHTPPP